MKTDERESVRPNENLDKSWDFMYHKKEANIDTSLYDRSLNALNKLDTLYNPTITRLHKPVIKGNYKVTGDTRVILIVEHEDDRIQWKCITSIYTDSGEPETLKE